MLDNSTLKLLFRLAPGVVALCFFASLPVRGDEAVQQLLAASDKAFNAGQFEEAASHAQQALQLDPNNIEAHNQLGVCYVNEHQFQKAAEQFQAALKGDPAYLPGLHNLGSVYYRTGAYTQAIDLFEAELQKHAAVEGKPSVTTMISLANVYRDRASSQRSDSGSSQRRSDYERALAYYKQAEALDPNSAVLHNNLGVYYFQQNDLMDAEAETRKATQLQTDYAAAYYNLAEVLEKQGRLKEASAAFRSSLQYETDPDYRKQAADNLTQLGAATVRRQEMRDLEMNLLSNRTGQSRGNGRRHDYIASAQALFDSSDFRSAESVLRKAVDGEGKGDPVAWNNLGYALAMQARLDEAIACYRESLKLLPDGFAAAQYNLGQALRRQGDLDNAQKCFNLAIEQTGGMNWLAHNALGLCYAQRKQFSKACSEYKLAILQCGDQLPVVHLNLGLALEAQAKGNRDLIKQAIAQFQRYIDQSPDGLNAAFARNRLAGLKRS